MTVSAYDAHPFPIYNARYRIIFPIYDNDGDLVVGASGLDTELSQDQGTFADATNEATQIATNSGTYYLDLIATELDTKCTAGIVKTTTTDAKTTMFTLYPVRLPVIRTGTAQAGATSTITLDSGASAVNDFYNGCFVNITNNTPSNVLGQARRIIDYVGSTKVATIEGQWGTNPSSSSTFEILLTPEASSLVAWAGTAVVDPSTVGLPNVNVTHAAGTAWASGAITASVIAADAIGASELATDAVTEIVNAVWANATRTLSAATNITSTGGTVPITGGGYVNADVAAIATSTAGAIRLGLSANTIIPGTVDSTNFTMTTTQFEADDITEATGDHYKNRVIIFTSGALIAQAAQITEYTLISGRGHFTVTTLTEAPSNNDTFIIV